MFRTTASILFLILRGGLMFAAVGGRSLECRSAELTRAASGSPPQVEESSVLSSANKPTSAGTSDRAIATLTGRVYGLGATGDVVSPVSNARLEVLASEGRRFSASTNEAGQFELKAIPVGIHRYRLEADSYLTDDRGRGLLVASPGAHSRDFFLSPPSATHPAAVDLVPEREERLGDPPATIVGRVYEVDRNGRVGALVLGAKLQFLDSSDGTVAASTASDHQGAYQAELEPGHYYYRARAQGYQLENVSRGVDIPSAGPLVFDLFLMKDRDEPLASSPTPAKPPDAAVPPPAVLPDESATSSNRQPTTPEAPRVEGTILRQSGDSWEPVRCVTVEALSPVSSIPRIARADADGKYSIPITPGTWRVRATIPDASATYRLPELVAAAGDIVRRDLRIPAPANGRFTADGWILGAAGQRERVKSAVCAQLASSPVRWPRSIWASEGRWDEQLPSGDWWVRVLPPPGLRAVPDQESSRIRVRSGETTHRDFLFEPAPVGDFGKVPDELANARPAHSLPESRRDCVSGSVVAVVAVERVPGRLPPGSDLVVELESIDSSLGTNQEPVAVARMEVRPLDPGELGKWGVPSPNGATASPSASSSIPGSSKTATGDPVQQGFVVVERSVEYDWFLATTSAQPPDEYRVRVRLDGYGEPVSAAKRVLCGEETHFDVTLPWTSPQIDILTVDARTDLPIAGVQVIVAPDGMGRSLVSGRTLATSAQGACQELLAHGLGEYEVRCSREGYHPLRVHEVFHDRKNRRSYRLFRLEDCPLVNIKGKVFSLDRHGGSQPRERPIPMATISLTPIGNGQETVVEKPLVFRTSGDGSYSCPDLPEGPYRAQIAAAACRTSWVVVTVDRNRPRADFWLEPRDDEFDRNIACLLEKGWGGTENHRRQAYRYYERAKAINKQDVAAEYALALCLVRHDSRKAGEYLAQAALRRDPQNYVWNRAFAAHLWLLVHHHESREAVEQSQGTTLPPPTGEYGSPNLAAAHLARMLGITLAVHGLSHSEFPVKSGSKAARPDDHRLSGFLAIEFVAGWDSALARAAEYQERLRILHQDEYQSWQRAEEARGQRHERWIGGLQNRVSRLEAELTQGKEELEVAKSRVDTPDFQRLRAERASKSREVTVLRTDCLNLELQINQYKERYDWCLRNPQRVSSETVSEWEDSTRTRFETGDLRYGEVGVGGPGPSPTRYASSPSSQAGVQVGKAQFKSDSVEKTNLHAGSQTDLYSTAHCASYLDSAAQATETLDSKRDRLRAAEGELAKFASQVDVLEQQRIDLERTITRWERELVEAGREARHAKSVAKSDSTHFRHSEGYEEIQAESLRIGQYVHFGVEERRRELLEIFQVSESADCP